MFEECRVEGDFTLASGRKSTVFYDFDLLKPMETAKYVERLIQEIPDEVIDEADFVASPALGGIVPGWLVSFATKKSFVIVDKEGKLRGPEFDVGSYLIVDDVVTSFQAANRVRKALPGKVCLGVASYIFRGSYADLQRQDYPAFYLSRKEQED